MYQLLMDALLIDVFEGRGTCSFPYFLIVDRRKSCFNCGEGLECINNRTKVRVIQRGNAPDVCWRKSKGTERILHLGHDNRKINEHLPFTREILIGKNWAERLVGGSNFSLDI